MPINPNIALGVRPMEQPNMLAQMGQMMAIRQAQQGYESENALRDFYAKGGDLSTAEGRRQVMSLSPSTGMKLIGQQSEISARDIGTAEKSLAMLKNQAGLVKTPQDAANWLSSFYKNPLTRPYVEAVAPMDQALAAIPTDPAALQGWLRNASLKADQIFESADAQLAAKTRIQAANIGATAPLGQLALAQQKFNLEQRQQDEVNRILRGEAPAAAPTVAPVSTGGPTAATPVGAGSVPTGASAPTAAPATAPTNALAPTGAPAAPTNALVAPKGDVYSEIARLDAQIRQLAGSGNPKALEAARVLNSQRSALLQSAQQQYGGQLVDMQVADPANPGKTITIKGRTDQYGRVMPAEMGAVPLSVDASATGGTTISPSVVRAPLTAGQERQVETARVKEEGQKTVNTVLGTLYQQYSGLVNQGGITDTSKSVAANLKASAGSNIIGQTVSGAVGGKAQEFRDSIEQTRPLLLNAIKNATGMSAQQLNSNVELQTYLKAATDPKLSIQANIKAMNNISTLFGLGEEFKIPVPEKKSSASSSGGVALPKGFKLDD